MDLLFFSLAVGLFAGLFAIWYSSERERSKETLARLLEAGAYTVLQKPPRTELLLEAVRRLAARIEDEDKNYGLRTN